MIFTLFLLRNNLITFKVNSTCLQIEDYLINVSAFIQDIHVKPKYFACIITFYKKVSDLILSKRQSLSSSSFAAFLDLQAESFFQKVILSFSYLSPISTIARSLYSYTKSVLFLTLMVQIMRYNWCKQVRFRNTVDPFIPISGGLMGAFALLLESKTRAQEIMLSIVPRYFETILNLLKRKGWMKIIPKGDVLVFAMILAIIHYYYQHDPKALKTTYRGMFAKFWGKN
ncbi:unnamed protein product (macronuclear) [Paramecium tetraurelia]|uniref:Transmembrane protein 135 N-terminal domain-containing protein n=1 Tax=Paramecium tetraurelia TaxID=5888 RepID=A0BNZ8_PARTE|nr:uncharacterized protein GSPATT00030904001 [Paramecium tetraurelia]CAK60265.1 unnamed protein product [Paramecium tetraurelia]|eukprot:XP_001427663.1 hypothetical protein (macronuclear) [Paramecium tetraurelia strain d4-2]